MLFTHNCKQWAGKMRQHADLIRRSVCVPTEKPIKVSSPSVPFAPVCCYLPHARACLFKLRVFIRDSLTVSLEQGRPVRILTPVLTSRVRVRRGGRVLHHWFGPMQWNHVQWKNWAQTKLVCNMPCLFMVTLGARICLKSFLCPTQQREAMLGVVVFFLHAEYVSWFLCSFFHMLSI